MTVEERAIFDAAEALNKANVASASKGAMRGLYRDNMSAEAKHLDQTFQSYYESQQPRTIGPQPIPLTSERHEIAAESIGFSLEMSEETRREIEEIERNAALARINAGKFYFD